MHIFTTSIDTDIDSVINMHLNNGTIIKFNSYSGDLYYYYTANMEKNTTNNQVTDYTFLNKSYFHRHETKGEDASIISQ